VAAGRARLGKAQMFTVDFVILKSNQKKIMASVKDLKKDIDLLMSLVLTDCFSVLEHNEKVDNDAILKIAGDVIKKHRELRLRANHPDGKDNPKLVKAYYNKLIQDTLKEADAAFERLSDEVKKVV
jgi:hypothetical protein